MRNDSVRQSCPTFVRAQTPTSFQQPPAQNASILRMSSMKKQASIGRTSTPTGGVSRWQTSQRQSSTGKTTHERRALQCTKNKQHAHTGVCTHFHMLACKCTHMTTTYKRLPHTLMTQVVSGSRRMHPTGSKASLRCRGTARWAGQTRVLSIPRCVL